MSTINWLDLLDWGKDQLEDLRFIGFAYIKEGKYDIAKTFFEAIITLSPNNAYDLQTLGAIYLQEGKNLEALTYIDKALLFTPKHSETLLNRAKALFSLGYKKQGISQANVLLSCENKNIANQAQALISAFA